MKLITEEISNAEYIVEEANGKKNYAIKGVFMQSDVKNRNGRIYPKEILQNIAKASENLSTKIWDDRDISIPLKNINELFILASIVEKETFLNEEKPIISGVFYNRLKKNMKLQSDPTVVYAITLGKKKMGRKLLRKDLKFKSKYNTYIHKELPPAPICIIKNLY